MDITEILSSGLKREIRITIPDSEIETKLMKRLADLRDQVRIKGFRPGKVPLPYLRKMHGKSLLNEIVSETLSQSTHKALESRLERPAMQPKIFLSNPEKAMQGQADFEFTVSYEIIPDIKITDLHTIQVKRLVCPVDQADIDGEIQRIAESSFFDDLSGQDKAVAGDSITINFVGTIDGAVFEGSQDSNKEFIVGDSSIIYGFEPDLVGLTRNETKEIEVVLPSSYLVPDLRGARAIFSISVVKLAKKSRDVLSEEMLKKLGFDSFSDLEKRIEQKIKANFDLMSFEKLKRQILDQLDALHEFDVPENLLLLEFQGIWNQLLEDLKNSERSFADENTTEEAAHEEYMGIARRRVKLGLILAEIGKNENISVAEEEIRDSLINIVNTYPDNQRQAVFENLRSNKAELFALHASIFEEKVVRYLLNLISIEDQIVSKNELMQEEQEEKEETQEKNSSQSNAKKNEKKDSESKKTKPNDSIKEKQKKKPTQKK